MNETTIPASTPPAPAAGSEQASARIWVLRKRGLFYRPGDHGYTGNINDAGRYTYEEAKARVYPHDEPVTMHLASDYDKRGTKMTNLHLMYCPRCGRREEHVIPVRCPCGSMMGEATVSDARESVENGPRPAPMPIPPPTVKQILDEMSENIAREYAAGRNESAEIWRRAAALVERIAA